MKKRKRMAIEQKRKRKERATQILKKRNRLAIEWKEKRENEIKKKKRK